MNADNKLITMKGTFVHVGDSEFSLNFLRNWKSHHVAIVVRALQCVPTARTSSFFLEEKKKKKKRLSDIQSEMSACLRPSLLPAPPPAPTWRSSLLFGVSSFSRKLITRASSTTSTTTTSDAAARELKEGIAEFYDESSSLWEDIWGDHMHHGFYEPDSSVSVSDHRAAQVRMIEETLRFAGVSGQWCSSFLTLYISACDNNYSNNYKNRLLMTTTTTMII